MLDRPEPPRAGADRLRERSTEYLAARGFVHADWLPLSDAAFALRPIDEIAGRLMALNLVFLWVSAPEEVAPTAAFWPYIETNRLQPLLTNRERGLIAIDRPDAQGQFGQSVGWRLENMWPLAWILGFPEEPPITAGMIDDDRIRAIVLGQLDGLGRSREAVAASTVIRGEDEVIALEDRFYCAHNAVRSAQYSSDDGGPPSVPAGFDPVVDGGCIHERRHALTWAVSPGVDWDATDLST